MKKRSITSQISLLIISFLIAGVLVAFITNAWVSSRQFEHAYEEKLLLTTKMLSESLAGPVWSYNYDATKTISEAFASNSDVAYLKVTVVDQAEPIFELTVPASSKVFTSQKSISYQGDIIGSVEVGLSSDRLTENLRWSFIYTMSLLLVMATIIVVGIRWSLHRLIAKPIATLTKWAQQIAKGDYGATSEDSISAKELLPVAQQIKLMSGEIERRENRLNDHIAIEDTLSRIHRQCIAFRKWDQAYSELLSAAMRSTQSASGLVAEFIEEDGGKRSLHVHAFMNISTGINRDATLALLCQTGIDSLSPTVANNPQEMPTEVRMAIAQAGVDCYLALPLLLAGKNVGLLFLANRKTGYSDLVVENLDSIRRSVSNMIAAIRDDSALRKSEDLNTAILDGALTGIITARIDGTILDCNPFALRILGGRREDIINTNVIKMFPMEEQRQRVRETLASVKKTGASGLIGRTLHMQALRRDGSEFPAELNVTVHKNGELLTGVLRDVTEEKVAEHALRRAQKMEAIGQLTGGIAHDFTNILGIIIGNLEFLMRPDLPGVNPAEHLESAYKASLRATQLTRQLLNFARKQPEHAATTDVNEVIRGMSSLISRSFTPQTSLICALDEDLWHAYLDSGELEDALLNLTINAADAMPNGGRLTIKTNNVVIDRDFARQNPPFKAGDYVEISVTDNGSGIEQKNIDKIFEPFFSTKERSKGTGLGLSMVFAFVNRTSGIVKAYSEMGVGTTIKIYLPRDRHELVMAAEAAVEPTGVWFGTETILVVDDEEELVKLAKANLTSLGYNVLTACDAKTALQVLQTVRGVALLFTDTVMPGEMNGVALAQKAVELYPGIRILITSGFAAGVTANNEDHSSGKPPLSKPYTKSMLARRIREELDTAAVS